ncbi:HD-GYP domain-containing protein [Aquipseudomonas alcaligenes]|uniref:HD domain-containing protein n=1 Tax=Aquipseudomonas alcaligenes TaxID=43263 RepID=A0AB73I0W0_AQUAC|nr:HD domain-containing phosphohydrolase [Pseudomonas alcaligenes]MDH0143849.1 HD domain-containing protein [Pseudomonas alcaligenes]
MSHLHDLQDQSPLQQKLRYLLNTLQQKYPEVQRMAVALYDHGSDWVKTFAAIEDGQNSLPLYHAHLADTTWLQAVANSQTPRVINDFSVLQDSHKQHVRALMDAGYRASYTLPMCVNGYFFGFVFFNARQPGVFTGLLLSELDMLGHLASLMVYNERSSVRTLLATLKSAMTMTHARDPETGNHLERMSRYSRLIAHSLAQQQGLDDSFVEHVYLFAPLHDLGKITVPDRVLLKPGRLTEDEQEVMRKHTSAGLELINQLLENFGLASVSQVQMLRHIVLHHHELYDGSGYPEGLAGEAIPLESRIVTVADVFDALTSDRPYKMAWSNGEAFAWMHERSGLMFDPAALQALMDKRDEVEHIQQCFRENVFG